MILTCPSCQARFKTNAFQIPEAGRLVRCSRCKHEWNVTPGSGETDDTPARNTSTQPLAAAETTASKGMNKFGDMPAPEPVEVLDDDFMKRLDQVIADEEANQRPPKPKPVRRQTDVKIFDAKPFKIAAPTLAAMWLVIAYFAYFPALADAPLIGSLYRAFGVTKTDGLRFQEVSMDREQDGSKARFIIAGSIQNTSAEERLVPTVRVVLRNKKNDALWTREYPVKHSLKAGEVYPFRITNVETAFASSVTVIEVDMGSSMQLMLR